MSAQKKHIFILSMFLMTVIVFSISACKKKRAFNEEDAQDTVDTRYTQGECDEVAKDINTVVMEQFFLRGRGMGAKGTATTSICGATVDTTFITKGIVTIDYSGTNCYGRTRSGKVKFSIEGYPLKKWKHAGCKINIEFIGYKLDRSTDGKTIQLDGTQTLVNESGNTWYELWYLNEPKVVNLMTGENLRATYNNGDYAKFNFNRRLTFTFSNFVTTCQVQGLGSAEGRSDLENWGQNRKGETFTSQVTSQYIWKTSCGAIAPVSGEVAVNVSGKEHTLKCFYAVDKDGNDVSGSTNPCPFGWKVTWNYKKKTNNRTFSFY